MDLLLRYVDYFEDESTKIRIRFSVLDRLLRRCPRGLCIEGTHLHPNFPEIRSLLSARANRADDNDGQAFNLPESLSGLKRTVNARGGVLFVAGCLGPKHHKQLAIQAQRENGLCWTAKKFGDKDVHDITGIIVNVSTQYKNACDGLSVNFLNLAANNFHKSIDDSIERMISATRMNETPPASAQPD